MNMSNYQKSTQGGPMMEQFVSVLLFFFNVFTNHTYLFGEWTAR